MAQKTSKVSISEWLAPGTGHGILVGGPGPGVVTPSVLEC